MPIAIQILRDSYGGPGLDVTRRYDSLARYFEKLSAAGCQEAIGTVEKALHSDEGACVVVANGYTLAITPRIVTVRSCADPFNVSSLSPEEFLSALQQWHDAFGKA